MVDFVYGPGDGGNKVRWWQLEVRAKANRDTPPLFVLRALASSAAPSVNSTTAAAQGSDMQKAATSDAQPPAEDDTKKLLAQRPVVVKYTGRVTVLLPPRSP